MYYTSLRFIDGLCDHIVNFQKAILGRKRKNAILLPRLDLLKVTQHMFQLVNKMRILSGHDPKEIL